MYFSLFSNLIGTHKYELDESIQIKTYDAERKVQSPSGLQDEIDLAISEYPSARAFVRPSGTEDVVRVYAEAPDEENVKKLADKIIKIVTKFLHE